MIIFPEDKVAVIIPTYNESSSIDILLKRIYKILPHAKIFIVDDSMLTENKKLKEKTKNSRVKVISRMQKLGRGSAVMVGFREALKDKDIKYFFEMDADLSHLPAEFPIFFEKIKKENADLVIGSRYLDGSATIDWPKWRIIMSKLANLYLNILLNLKLTDYTDGFRLYTRNAVEFLTKEKFKTSGFILLSESSYKLRLNKFVITEVPIHFVDRKYGKSSMGPRELFYSLFGILKVRFIK